MSELASKYSDRNLLTFARLPEIVPFWVSVSSSLSANSSNALAVVLAIGLVDLVGLPSFLDVPSAPPVGIEVRNVRCLIDLLMAGDEFVELLPSIFIWQLL